MLVLEGQARRGPHADREARCVPFTPRSGDEAIVDEVRRQVAVGDGRGVVVVTADRQLRDRVEEAGASGRSPTWLLEQL